MGVNRMAVWVIEGDGGGDWSRLRWWVVHVAVSVGGGWCFYMARFGADVSWLRIYPPRPRAGPSSVQWDAVEWREGWGARGAGGERGEVYGGKLTSLTLRPPAPSSVLQRPAGPPRTSESKLQLLPAPPHQPQRPLVKPASGGRAVDATFSSTCFFLAIP